ncbi:MAG: PRC-barrel domain-containing protein [Patescibacteria group bacterium]
MTLNSSEMRGVRVETRSGQPLGKVASFDMDAMTGRLVAMRVKAKGLIPGLMEDELSVAWDAIIELLPQKVVVADSTVTVTAQTLTRTPASLSSSTLMKEG